jgi:tetratricopeptide (TPR) repeat protein
LPRSIDLLEQAIAIEPTWPLAHAALADAYNLAANNGVLPFADGYPKGIAAARRALKLDPELGQAHIALAFATWQLDRNWDGAEKGFRRGIDLQPSYASAHHFYALFLVAKGRDAEGLAEIRKALELDPLSPRINTNYGDILRVIGRDAEAIAQYEKWVDADPRQALRGLVCVHVQRNEPAKALEVAARARKLIPELRIADRIQMLAMASAMKGDALPLIRRLDVEMQDSDIGATFVTLAAAYLVAGDEESAWDALLRSVPNLVPNLMILREPLLEPMRKDPRYQEILKEFNLQASP